LCSYKKNLSKWTTEHRIDLVVDLIKYAPDEIINKFSKFWDIAKSNDMKNTDLSLLYTDILILIRKDLGYKNTEICGDKIKNLLISE